MPIIEKKYIYIIFFAIGIFISYGIYNFAMYRYNIYIANKNHQETSVKINDLQKDEKRLEQEKEDLDKIIINNPSQKEILDFLNKLK